MPMADKPIITERKPPGEYVPLADPRDEALFNLLVDAALESYPKSDVTEFRILVERRGIRGP